MEKGLIHIYHGNGKGKTTAGMGLCLRAIGSGKKVLIHQFLKDNTANELKILATLPNVDIIKSQDTIKFINQMTSEELVHLKEFTQSKFTEIVEKSKDIDVLFLDEVLHVLNMKILNEDIFIDFLENKPEKLEVILTGYYPSDRLIKIADYISKIEKEKHPFDKGINAREGIEF